MDLLSEICVNWHACHIVLRFCALTTEIRTLCAHNSRLHQRLTVVDLPGDLPPDLSSMSRAAEPIAFLNEFGAHPLPSLP